MPLVAGEQTLIGCVQVKVWAHIADPSRWISPGSVLAAEAKERATTMYMATGGAHSGTHSSGNCGAQSCSLLNCPWMSGGHEGPFTAMLLLFYKLLLARKHVNPVKKSTSQSSRLSLRLKGNGTIA